MRFIKTISLVSFVLLFTCAFSQEKIEWRLEPGVDTLTSDNLNNLAFSIQINGKKGYFKNNQTIVPAAYEEVIYVNEYYYDLYLIKNSSKWGLFNSSQYLEELPCKYDTLIFDNDPFVKAVLKNTCAYYDLGKSKWATGFVKNCKLPPSQVPIIIADEEIEDDMMVEDGTMWAQHGGPTEPDVVAGENNYNRRTKTEASKEEKKLMLETAQKLLPGKEIVYTQKLSTNYFVFTADYKQTGVMSISPPEIIVEGKYTNIILKNGYIICFFDREYNEAEVLDTLTGKKITPRFTINPFYHPVKAIKDSLQRNYTLANIRDGASPSTKRGLYDKNYTLVIPFEYQSITFETNPNLAFCKKDNIIRLFNLYSNTFIEQEFDLLHYSHYGVDDLLVAKKGKIYFYNLKTNTLKKSKINSVEYLPADVYDTVLIVNNKKNKRQLFDYKNKSFIGKAYDSINFIHLPPDNSYGRWGQTANDIRNEDIIPQYFAYKAGNKSGLLSHTGDVYLPAVYDSIVPIKIERKKLIYLYQENLITMIYPQKEIIISDSISQIHTKEIKYINDRGSQYNYTQQSLYKRNTKWGIFNFGEDIYIPALYDTIYYLKYTYVMKQGSKYRLCFFKPSEYPAYLKEYPKTEGMSSELYDTIANWPKTYIMAKVNGKTGVYHQHGALVVPFEYTSAAYSEAPGIFSIGYKKDNKVGVLGEVKTRDYFNPVKLKQYPAVFDDYVVGNNNLIWAKYNGKWGILK